MNYIGEHTWAGQLGHVLTIVSFIGALLATVAYGISTERKDRRWTTVGRLAFRAHSVAVLGIVTVLFVMLFNHWFQYDYVWKHSNLAMPMKFIASCFWEGQEGSFLLWTFWHVVLGNILIFRAGKWEAPVLAVFAAVQVFLATMLLGVYIGDVRIGSSPFLLVRELPENLGMPWTRIPEYITRIPELADGRGLNPLLQNYWMVIHPPTLFLGFAATLVPFAYAIAGLWTDRRRAWMDPALPWTFFGVGVLGAGILMGGAWAYEALSFGGFWAWDPVENASLVPWLTLVAAGHLMMVNRRKETSLFTTFLLTLATFIFVLYSTFLTRSGVLGDTSVHSFTGDGMLPGLLVFMLFFTALGVAMMGADRGRRGFYALVCAALLAIGTLLQVEVGAILLFGAVSIAMLFMAYRRDFNDAEEEEALWSREFWLFMGALVLLLSSLQITFSTSIPVFNLMLEPFGDFFARAGRWLGSDFISGLADARLAPPAEPVPHYNKWQLPFAFIVSLLVAFTQYLRWRKSDGKKVLRALLVPFLLAVAITIALALVLRFRLAEMNLVALLFATVFAAVANAAYIPSVLKGSLRHAGPSVAHTGFALLLLGALISTGRKTEMSRNNKGMDLRFLNENFTNNENILLYRDDTVHMGEFHVVYHNKRHEGHNLYYDMDYFSVVPQLYHAGDTVRAGDMLFRARNDHQAGEMFLLDQPAHWEPIETFTRQALWNAREWTPVRPGEKVFELAPYLQLNERMGNVPEPSTKHWWHRDLYTHIRYADMATETDSANFGWMPDRRYDKMVGDTIVTPTSVAIIDSVYVKRDSTTLAMLGDAFTVYAMDLRIRDLYRSDRWFTASPVVVYANGEPVAGKPGEVPALRVRYGLGSVSGDVDDQSSVQVGLDVAESEFLVMQALVFPGINILWIGCVLMLLGTGMAVWQRLRTAKRTA
ncbi:MAG: cytochrome c biogenesis protein CcsA [Flavobacteriales bacterium]|jgi:cytochrome c-type biogenesis protein CcmF|nr:cytochrome c biogenesis protein CcsA [Flavobacteriales bacterium]